MSPGEDDQNRLPETLVIGAGMAGIACARALAEAGHAVRVLDKGRGPGGRMATRRVTTRAGEVRFDHGAQYLTARDPALPPCWPPRTRPRSGTTARRIRITSACRACRACRARLPPVWMWRAT